MNQFTEGKTRPEPVVFMFSGQGSQYFHMGKELQNTDAVFREWMQRLDRHVCTLTGRSCLTAIYDADKSIGDAFDRTLLTHPSIFMVEYALARALMARNIVPQYILGASLGEFCALALAGYLSWEEALSLVVKQAAIAEQKCEPGGMLAILDNPANFDRDSFLYAQSELAAVNFPSHYVVSGLTPALENIKHELRIRNVAFQDIWIKQAFHSRHIEPIKNDFQAALSGIEFRNPEIPLISCTTGGLITDIPRHHLWNVCRQRIEFRKTIEGMESEGRFLYLDLGPSGTLATFVKYNLSDRSGSAALATLTPYSSGIRNIEKIGGCFMEPASIE
jgi:acyl transferase domain-containing protein